MVKSNFIDLGDASTVVAGRFKFAFIFELLSAGGPPFSHFDPFGTEFCVSRGGSAILSEFRIANFGFRIGESTRRWVFKSAIRNPQSEVFTKILPTFAVIPGGHAPVLI